MISFCKTHLWRGAEPQKPCSSARGESCSALRRMRLEVVTESRRRCDAVGAVVCTILPMRLQPRSCLPWVPPFPLLTCWELVWYVAACQHLPSTSFSPGAHGCRASAAHTGLWGAAVTPTSSARCHTSPRCEGAVTHCDTPAVMFERARAQKQAHLISFLCEP